MFWAYIHTNGSLLIKRWFGDHRDYTDDCIGNPNVLQVVRPFEADTKEEAYMNIERHLDGDITGQ